MDPLLKVAPFLAFGYSFEGCLEAIGVRHNNENYIYAVFQTANYTSFVEASVPFVYDLSAQGINKTRQAQAKLYKIRVATGTWTLLRDYAFVSAAARSLREVNGTVYWFEGSHYCYWNEGKLERVENPDEQFYVDIGELTRKATVTSAGQWRADSGKLYLWIDADDEKYASIKVALRDGNYLLIDRQKVEISGVTSQIVGNRAGFTMSYALYSGNALPAVDESSVFRMNVGTYREVYSSYRFRRLFLTLTATPRENWKADVGHLWSVSVSSDTPVDLGTCWTSADISEDPHRDKPRPAYQDYDPGTDIDKFYGVHGGMASPLMWDGTRLSFVAGYSRLDALTDNSSEAARTENWHWLQYSSEVNPRVVTLETNDRTAWDVLKAVAIMTDCYIAVEGDRVEVQPRVSARGELVSALTASHTGYIGLQSPTRTTFASSGLLRIDSELLEYSVLSSGNPSALVRGVEGTTAASHAAEATVYWVDHIIDYDRYAVDPLDRIVIENDETQIYNFIRVRFGEQTWPASNSDSITKYGLLELPTVDIGLDATQKVAAASVAERILMQLKRPRQVVTLTLKLSLYLKRMDVLLVREAYRTHLETLLQVIEIDHQLFRNVSVVKCVNVIVPTT